jgi:hypothetical protein
MNTNKGIGLAAKYRLLPPALAGSFVLFVVLIRQVALWAEARVEASSTTTIENHLAWIQLYPISMFVAFDGIIVIGLMLFTFSIVWYLDGSSAKGTH